MKGIPCGSQAVTHVGGTPQSEKPATACGIRCLKRKARSLERGAPRSQERHSFPPHLGPNNRPSQWP